MPICASVDNTLNGLAILRQSITGGTRIIGAGEGFMDATQRDQGRSNTWLMLREEQEMLVPEVGAERRAQGKCNSFAEIGESTLLRVVQIRARQRLRL